MFIISEDVLSIAHPDSERAWGLTCAAGSALTPTATTSGRICSPPPRMEVGILRLEEPRTRGPVGPRPPAQLPSSFRNCGRLWPLWRMLPRYRRSRRLVFSAPVRLSPPTAPWLGLEEMGSQKVGSRIRTSEIGDATDASGLLPIADCPTYSSHPWFIIFPEFRRYLLA